MDIPSTGLPTGERSSKSLIFVAVGLGFVLIGAVLVGVLARAGEPLVGTNSRLSISGVAVAVPASRTRCQTTDVPGGTRALRVFADAKRGGGPLRVSVARGRQVVVRGRSAPVSGEGPVTIRLDRTLRGDLGNARICIDNDGTRNVQLAGDRTPPAGPNNPAKLRADDDARIDFVGEARSSYAGMASDVAARASLFKVSWFGPSLLVLVALATVGAWALAVLTLVRR